MNKSALKRLAVEVRQEVGVGLHEPFDPYALAEMYGVDVYGMSDVACSSEALEHFQVRRPDVFSGALIPYGSGVVILENELHVPARRRSTLGHEMAHLLLEHPFSQALVNERGCRTADDEHEHEARELGAELLLPFEAAKRLARQDASNEDAAQAFDVSIDVARWRLDSTGARKIVARERAAYRRRLGRAD